VLVKTGATAPLGFVSVMHIYAILGRRALSERQDIVYRAPSGEAAKPAPAPDAEPLAAYTVEATPTLLFRYSAMTFNGHRIHYDAPYATAVEGYAGLVVHGPMQATLMLKRFASNRARVANRLARIGRDRFVAQHVRAQAHPFALILDRQHHRAFVGESLFLHRPGNWTLTRG
jgi:hydroxyacyl-ACP dehydratase HTD2-like protein with hotdog domain